MRKFVKKLSHREICDLELLLNGAFSPLNGFMKEEDFHSVLEVMRLADGTLWPIPIILTLSLDEQREVGLDDTIILQSPDGTDVAEMSIESLYPIAVEKQATAIFGVDDMIHPYVQILHEQKDYVCAGGQLRSIKEVPHDDYHDLRLSPQQLKAKLASQGWDSIIAFQTRNPMHRSHFYLTLRALKETEGNAGIMLHPVVGVTQPVDINYQLRVKCYKELLRYYPPERVILSLLPLSMRMAGPREALWHAIVRKNYGATHFIVGRDHAGPSYKRSNGQSFFPPYAAQELVAEKAKEIGITPIFSQEIVYVEETGLYLPKNEVPDGMTIAAISGTQQRKILNDGGELPHWFTFPEISSILTSEYKLNADNSIS